MTLKEMSLLYEQSAMLLRCRIHSLRLQLQTAEDPELRWQLRRRINDLKPMLTQMNDLAELTARYYERGYHHNEKYTL